MTETGIHKAKMIPVEELFAAWRKDPKYVEAYDALEAEFARAAATGMRLRISFEARRPGEG
jgi:hypothetical protein